MINLGNDNCYIISPSDSIPTFVTIQPPHKQAAAFYRDIVEAFGSKENFIVTMEWPTINRPRPIVIESTPNKFKLKQDPSILGGASVIISKPSPRLG